MNKVYNKQVTRKNQMRPTDRNRVKTSQAKLKDKNPQSPFNVFSGKGGKKQGIASNGNEEYFSRKTTKNESKGGMNQMQKHKIKIKTESPEYDRLHQKLQSIEIRISEMKQNLQKKRQQKEKRQRQKQKSTDESRKLVYSQDKLLLKKKNKIQTKRQAKQTPKMTQEKEVKSSSNGLQGFITQQKSKANHPNQNLKNLVTQVPQSHAHTFENNPYSPRSNIYYVSEIVKAYKDDHSLAREHIKTSFELLKAFQNVKLPSKQVIAKKAVNLPKRRGYEDKKTIIFDLDQTLIHCNQNLQMGYQVKLPIKFPTGEVIEAGINIRPGAQAILKSLNKHYEVIIFTASHPCYANVVIDYLDPTGELVHHRLFREHCYLVNNGPYVKDLRIIDRDPAKMVLVDNAAYSYVFQQENGIPILPYYQGVHDFELKELELYLQKFLLVDDVRTVNRHTFRFREYTEFGGYQEVVEKLYIK